MGGGLGGSGDQAAHAAGFAALGSSVKDATAQYMLLGNQMVPASGLTQVRLCWLMWLRGGGASSNSIGARRHGNIF